MDMEKINMDPLLGKGRTSDTTNDETRDAGDYEPPKQHPGDPQVELILQTVEELVNREVETLKKMYRDTLDDLNTRIEASGKKWEDKLQSKEATETNIEGREKDLEEGKTWITNALKEGRKLMKNIEESKKLMEEGKTLMKTSLIEGFNGFIENCSTITKLRSEVAASTVDSETMEKLLLLYENFESKYQEIKTDQAVYEKLIGEPYKIFRERISDVICCARNAVLAIGFLGFFYTPTLYLFQWIGVALFAVVCAGAAIRLALSSWSGIEGACKEFDSSLDKASMDSSAVIRSSVTMARDRRNSQYKESCFETIFLGVFAVAFTILVFLYACGKMVK